VKFTLDGQWVAGGGGDRIAYIWSGLDGILEQKLIGHKEVSFGFHYHFF
jgi:hypothetical protein